MAAAISLAACGGDDGYRAQSLATDPAALDSVLNPIAESYVKLVLAVGEHDANYVDAYYGPPAWRAAARQEQRPLSELRQAADSLLAALGPLPADSLAPLAQLRHRSSFELLHPPAPYPQRLATPQRRDSRRAGGRRLRREGRQRRRWTQARRHQGQHHRLPGDDLGVSQAVAPPSPQRVEGEGGGAAAIAVPVQEHPGQDLVTVQGDELSVSTVEEGEQRCVIEVGEVAHGAQVAVHVR